MQLGRLICSTVSQPDYSLISTMWDYLQWMPLCVRDPVMVLTIAACGRTSTFNWDNNSPVLPPQDTFGFIIEHYTEFDQLTVPMWMWLSICIQAVMKEEISSSGPMVDRSSGFSIFWAVSRSNTYNTVAEQKKISAWFQRHLIPDGLQHSVDHGPFRYRNRYVPVSLATFLAVIKQGRSFDDSFYGMDTPHSFLDNNVPDPPKHHRASQCPSQPLPDTIYHNSLLLTRHSSSPSHPTASSMTQSQLSASAESIRFLQMSPEAAMHSASLLSPLSVQNISGDAGPQGTLLHGPPSAHSIREPAPDN
ncbi:hypothetical protein B0H14DRAFT_582183 [Mycena olivaceomarginata]|nr:hypothetical protein B0H14DRAFT_582183 [Mycena olivaceomarginata]